MNTKSYEKAYKIRFTEILEPFIPILESHVKEILNDLPRIDYISSRAKSINSFIEKANKKENGKPKYSDPLNQIQDQLGIRIVTFYKSDVEPIKDRILEYLAPIEKRFVVPDSEDQFGYEGLHLILLIPRSLTIGQINFANLPQFFELQIHTLFQHAWAQANHGLSYKPFTDLSKAQLRKISFTAAQAWGADNIFAELLSELN
jgi:ppGpp synthetase/RelA/SpoT-type nucleotidyltranferase